jgi:predicted ATPase
MPVLEKEKAKDNSLQGYNLKETLFRNAHTEVYRAHRDSDGLSVILRRFSNSVLKHGSDGDPNEFEESLASDSTNSSRYARLAFTKEVLSQFDHPNIVKVIDWHDDKTNEPCIVMEDIHGIDLWQYADTFPNKQLPIQDFLQIAIQLADALSVIHHAQIIHKDLHPGNMVVNAETGQVQIIDFGLASLLSREQPALAAPDKLEGILAYISPEQTGRMNRALDYRSDFYTLGVTFYYLLCGEQPFKADDALGMVYAHMAVTQTPVSQRRKDVPQVLSNIIDKLMHKNAESRYQSALGLKHDLERCLEGYNSNTEPSLNKEFELGEEDVSANFSIPQVLYGREQEVQTLMNRFHDASMGRPQLLAVAGYSGIGKSALIHEVHKPIAAHSGLFLQGKFDQFQQNVPYSAIKRALNGWLQHALSLHKESFESLRAALLDTLGSNARVLVDFMDEFKRILYQQTPGDLAPVPELGAQESQNRFFLVIRRFIKIVSQHRPLVIFIDDLQWADRGTLNLLPQILSEAECRLLVIVAYRDNEVDDVHPAMQMLNNTEWREENQVRLSTVTLSPLPAEQIENLLQDALYRNKNDIAPLAELLIKKTDGNPFFSIEFLKKLYAEKLLNFELEARQWTWDIKAIEAKDITDNVVELMLGKMQNLPKATQDMMQLAACVGTYFDVETLAMLAQRSMPDVARALWPALQEGLLIQEGGDWFLGMLGHRSEFQASINDPRQNIQETDKQTEQDASEHQHERRKSPWVPRCKFLHDRMLQAAYESLDENSRKAAHLSVGRMLLQHYDEEQINTQLFAIVEQLNHGRSLIEKDSEAIRLAELNLTASKRAMDSSVWDAALHHAEVGISLVSPTNWEKNHDTLYGLYFRQVESEFLLANPEKAKFLAEALLDNTLKDIEKAEVCLLLASQQMMLDVNYCIDKAFLCLQYCGFELPPAESIDPLQVKQETDLLKAELDKKGWECLVQQDPKKIPPTKASIAYRVCAQLVFTGNIAGKPLLSLYIINKSIRIVLETGINKHTPLLYAVHSAANAKQGNYFESYQMAQAAFSLLERYPQCADAPFIYMSIGSLVLPFHKPLSAAIQMQLKGYELGYEMGDTARGVIGNYSNALVNRFAQGEPLERLSTHASTLSDLKRKLAAKIAGGSYYWRLFKMLKEPHSDNLLIAASFSDAEWKLIQSCVLKAFIEHLTLQQLFWSGQDTGAWKSILESEGTLQLLSGFIAAIEHRLIGALLACRQLTTEAQQADFYVQRSLVELQELSGYCPENYTHKLDLLKAEMGLANGEAFEVLLPLYESAILSAKENGFLQFQALANELLARCSLSKGATLYASHHMQEAVSLYVRWGCRVKVQYLKEHYADLLGSGINEGRVVDTEPLNADRLTSKRDNRLEGLDLQSVMKSAQAISGELEVKSLLGKVLDVIVENSGAQHAAFISGHLETATVEAHLSIESDHSVMNVESQALTESENLPITLVQYVLRSGQELHLDEHRQIISERIEEQDDLTIDDAYLARSQPKSVLCTPVIYRDQVVGALYLENQVTTDAFPQARLNVIKMLLSQVAISYENAKLFDEVTQLNIGLEKKVAQRTKDLNQAVADLEISNSELNAYAHTVSHDLRAPVRNIRSYTEILQEDLEGKLDADTEHLFNRIKASTSKMYELINALLELSKMQQKSVNKKLLDLSAMVNEFFQEMRERRPDQIVLSRCIHQAYVMADSAMMKSVLDNLINNAWKYSSKNPHAEVTFGRLDEHSAIPTGVGKVPATLPEGYAIFFVKDNGDGFDMDHAKELFGSFKRLHSDHEFEGTGIGLATVKKVIEKHGGTIWVEAYKGKGATFYFTLPTD